MKEKFLSYSMTTIKANNNFDEIKLAELKYGLETFYMLISKMLVFVILAAIFHVLPEFLLFILFYTPLRGFGFGFHANNSKQCWLITSIAFLLFPILSSILKIPLIIVHIFMILCIINFLFFAPADTKKKPLINTKKRLTNKIIIISISLCYLLISVIVKNNLIINSIMFACIWQAVCTNPLTYKIFKQPFNNYLNYLN